MDQPEAGGGLSVKVGLSVNEPASAVADARLAEQMGFDYLAVGEHLFFHGPVPNPFVQLAAAAGATSNIRLVSAVSLLSLYPAPLAAKMAVTLDQVSGGRFEFGVGAGGEFPEEFRAVGVDPSTRFRRLEEGLSVLRLLFSSSSPVSFDGEFTRFADICLEPGPVQDGGPPIWLGGRKERSARRAGHFADVWLPYLVTPDLFAEGLGRARVAALECGRREDDIRGAVLLFVCADDDAAWAQETGVATVSSTYGRDFTPLADRYLVLGSPEEVVLKLLQFHEAGADVLLLHVAASGHSRGRVIDTVGRDVLPKLKAAQGLRA